MASRYKLSLEKARTIAETVEQEWPKDARFTPLDLAEMADAGFLPIDLLDPEFAPERCHLKGCKGLLVYQGNFPLYCFQHSLGWHAEWGNPGAEPDPFNGGPYIPIAERNRWESMISHRFG